MHILNKNGFAKLNTYIPFESFRPHRRHLFQSPLASHFSYECFSALTLTPFAQDSSRSYFFFLAYLFRMNPFLNLTNAQPNRIEETHHRATLTKILEITLILFDLSTSLIYAFILLRVNEILWVFSLDSLSMFICTFMNSGSVRFLSVLYLKFFSLTCVSCN